MKTPAERGLYGRWLLAAREARGLDTADKARAALATAGIKIGQSTYAEYESGAKRPSRNHMPLLESFWGPPGALDATETPDQLVSALRDQTAAINDLVAELRQEREDGRGVASAFDRAAARLLEALRPGDSGASVARSSPRGSTG